MMPERVEAIAVVSGAPPIAELEDRSGLLRFYNWMLALRGSHRDCCGTSFTSRGRLH